jgi:hypothetical protein
MEMLDAIRSWANEKGYLHDHEGASEGPSKTEGLSTSINQLRPLSPIDDPLPSGRSTPKKVASGGTFGSENEEKLKMVGEEEGNTTNL